ncbi:hypothetical protein ACFLQW_03895 [Candidatus Zixiibacteriota bacterium]
MSENRYALAGWLSIAQAVIFPLAVIVSIIQGIIGVAVFDHRGPSGFGPSDLLLLLGTGLFVYTYYMFRQLLNERYNYHGLDMLITINIALAILIQIGSFFSRVFITVLAPTLIGRPVVFFSMGFMILSAVAAGIVCILMAIQLLRAKEKLSDLITALAVVMLIEGVCLITVILMPLQWVLLPVARIMLGTIFLRAKEQVEFV